MSPGWPAVAGHDKKYHLILSLAKNGLIDCANPNWVFKTL